MDFINSFLINPIILAHAAVLYNATVPIYECMNGNRHGSAQHLCAGIFNRKATFGDSGGPLMIVRNGTIYQIGVTSGGVDAYSEFCLNASYFKI